MQTLDTFSIDDVTVHVQGQGEQILLLLHGWPDSHQLWDTTVAGLQDRYQCVRFSLPGFDIDKPPRPQSLAETTELIAKIVDRVSPGKAVTLVMHDWGCIFGYEYAAQYPEKVVRMVAVDIGDHNSGAFLRSLPAKSKLQIVGYQLPLALAWTLGRFVNASLATGLTRRLARVLRCPTPVEQVCWQKNYVYAMAWFGLRGGFGRAIKVQPTCPLLYIYAKRKPFMFHSSEWLARLDATPGSKTQGFATGHWVMLEQPQAFVDCLRSWLPAS